MKNLWHRLKKYCNRTVDAAQAESGVPDTCPCPEPVIDKIVSLVPELWERPQQQDFTRDLCGKCEGVKALYAIFDSIPLDTVSEISYRLGSNKVALWVRDAGKWKEESGLSLSYDQYHKLLGVFKVAADCKMIKPGMSASGAAAFEVFYNQGPSRKFQMRVSLLPSFADWNLSLRLIKEEDDIPILLARPIHLKRPLINQPGCALIVKEALCNSGIVLVTGPTGQGKTTTCYSMLRDLATSPGVKKNVVSLEDPVESRMSFAMQVEVSANKFPITDGFRALLRHDPDVIFVGEVRSAEAAEVVVQAAAAGNLTIATIHAENITSAIQRMLAYGVNPGLFADSLLCVTNQRLERMLCQHCSKPLGQSDTQYSSILKSTLESVDSELRSKLNLRTKSTAGCSNCDAGESKERIALFEAVSASDELRKWIKSGLGGGIQSLPCTPYRSFKQGVFEVLAQGLMDPKSVYLNKFRLLDNSIQTSSDETLIPFYG